MAAEYNWSSPGGVYRVPDGWKERFLSEFPDYRVRWSLRKGTWQIEQSFGNPVPPVRIDDGAHDDLIRARDGFWLVLQTAPGNRIACPGIITKHPRQVCENTIRIPRPHWQGEVVCETCRRAGRDGRTVTGYFPFDEKTLDLLRRTNPLTWGVMKQDGKTQTRAAVEADRANRLLQQEADRRQSEAITSIDAVDYRWITGIASTSGIRRRTISDKDLL